MSRFKKKSKIEPKIPTASMADIAFLLLIYFLATTIFKMEEGLNVHLPKAVTAERVPRESVSHIWIDASGKISIDDKSLVIVAVTVIVLVAMWVLGADAKDLVSNAITGMFGVAVGRSMNGGQAR